MATAEASDVIDRPVLSVINKRIRALKKKLNRISQMEESLAKGKTLNKEQEETFRTKPSIVAAIDELEKLRVPISAAVEEEISTAIENYQASAQEAQASATTQEEAPDEPEKEVERKGDGDRLLVAEDLLNLMYFGSMFDVKNLQNHFTEMMLSREHERGSCLSYDYMKDDDSIDLLNEMDLDLLSMLSGLLISRPANSSLPHKNALQRCIEHAKLWLENSTQPIESDSNVTYAGLRAKLNKIMASQYFVAAPVGLQAAAMSYGSFQAPVHEPVPPLDVPVQVHVEDNGVQYQQKEVEETAGFHDNETHNHQPNHEDQLQQVEEKTSALPSETEHTQPEGEEGTHEEHNDDKVQQKQHQVPRRPYQNHNNHRGGGGARGGGRRGGYSNGRGGRGGRGGGGYQNGRNNHYDQPGNFIPRNTHFRGRGGRGGHYGGNHHPFGGQAGNYGDEHY